MAQHPPSRLAAILALDVVGYSRLMQADEAGTLARLKAHRTEFWIPEIARHGGRVVGTAGDSLLAEFPSAVAAVDCALSIQDGIREREAGLSDSDRMLLRIGINAGEVIADGEDVFGDGVNIAARLQSLAPAGGIAISDKVHREIAGRLPASFADTGSQHLKNLPEPVRVWHWVPGAVDDRHRPAMPLPDRPSLVVLPFDNLSGDPEQAYFADGITDEITTGLGRIRSLFVIARNSAFAYRGRQVDVRQIGRELGVRYVLEGSVRKAGNRLRITVQLIDAGSAEHLWADKFDGALEDVFALQDEVTATVAGAIEPALRRAEIERARRKPTDSLDAHDLYLRALPHAYAMTPEGNAEALRLVDRALAFDPDYAAAAGVKAWCHEQRYLRGWSDDAEAERDAAEHAARRTLMIAGDDPVALAMGGFVLSVAVHDHDAALAALDHAVQVNPNSALALGFASLVRCFAGQYERVAEAADRALRLSPLDPLRYLPLLALAYAGYLTGRFEEAAAQARRAIQANPGFENCHAILVASLVELGRLEEAGAAARRLLAVSPAFRLSRSRRAGRRDTAGFERYLSALRKAGIAD